MRQVNHEISKRIVKVAEQYGLAIAVERLYGIRHKDRGKQFNRAISNWSYYKLKRLIEYKAKAKGIPVYYVKPKHTLVISLKAAVNLPNLAGGKTQLPAS